eukprot:1111540-Pleurochrysis_carterae.AAC.1
MAFLVLYFVPATLCDQDPQVKGASQQQSCLFMARKSRSFPAADRGGGESLQNSLIKIERARDVPSRGSPAASRGSLTRPWITALADVLRRQP